MKGRRRSIGDRDQRATAFSAALMRLCDAASALGAALVDAEGETVAFAGVVDPFDIKVAAAEWAVVISRLRAMRVPLLAGTEIVRVRARKKSFVMSALADDYSLIVQLLPHAFAISERAMSEAVREVSLEAGLPLPPSCLRAKEQWCRVDVRCEPAPSRRPAALWVRGGWLPLEVLGRWTRGLGSHEVGYRARLKSGAEFALVRERLGRWYTEAPLPF
jgi:hypothetical protein